MKQKSFSSKNHKRKLKQRFSHIKIISVGFIALFILLVGVVYIPLTPSSENVLGSSTVACNPCQWWNVFCKAKGIFSRYPCTTPTPILPSPTSAHGIYQFVGQQNPANATKPYLKGALLNYYWSQIEPSKGVFNWNQIDTDMQPWINVDKFVILRISTSGNCYSNQPGSCSRTPAWVYADGARSITDSTGAVYPVFWDKAYLTDLQQFLQAFAARYDKNPSVTYIDAAVANDGETIISKDANGQAYALWQPYGYTDIVWLSTIKQILSFYGQNFHNKFLAVQPDKTFIQPKKTKGALSEMTLLKAVVSLHNQYPNLIFQNDSLFPNQNLSTIWHQIPLSLEQGQAAGNTTTLQGDLQTALNEKASYVLVFTKDINNPANQTALQNAANKFGY